MKIQSCQRLQGKTIADIVNTAHFIENLTAYMEAQRQDREAIKASYEAMKKLGVPKGYKLPAHACDGCLKLSPSEFAAEWLKIIQHTSDLRSAERTYIRQLSLQAYNKTIIDIVLEEFPELEDKLIPKSNEQN